MTLERLSVGIWKSAKLVEKSNPEGINQYTGGGGSGDVNGGGHTDQMMANHGHTSSVNNGTSAPTASQARLDHVLTARDSGTHANHGSGASGKTSTIMTSRDSRSQTQTLASHLQANGFNATAQNGPQGHFVDVTHP